MRAANVSSNVCSLANASERNACSRISAGRAASSAILRASASGSFIGVVQPVLLREEIPAKASFAYPTIEKGGVVWAYMGPKELQPAEPDYEWTRAPATQRTLDGCPSSR